VPDSWRSWQNKQPTELALLSYLMASTLKLGKILWMRCSELTFLTQSWHAVLEKTWKRTHITNGDWCYQDVSMIDLSQSDPLIEVNGKTDFKPIDMGADMVHRWLQKEQSHWSWGV
jgi:hypothetical protein